MSILLLVSGIAQITIGFRRRRKLVGCSEDKRSELEHAEGLILLGVLQFGWASYFPLRGSPYSLVGIALLVVVLAAWGTTRIGTRNGRAVLILGLFLALFGGATLA